MAFISTFYDKTLDDTGKPIGRVFVVRGEERYARTTNTLLMEHGERREDWDESIRFFKIGLEAKVLRSLGTSIISLYDNDDLLISKEVSDMNPTAIWDYIDEEHDERLKLAYDMEHNIKAVFQGNNSCLKSKSEILTINIPKPPKYESNIRVIGAVKTQSVEYPLQLVLMSDNTKIHAKLESEHFYAGKTIQLYEGDTLIGESETDDNGEIIFELINPTKGIHAYTLKYDGDDNLISATTTVYTSIGYNIQLLSYPKTIVNAESSEIKVKITDYFNNPFENIETKLVTDSSTVMREGKTNSEGILNFTKISFVKTTSWKIQTPIDETDMYTTAVTTVSLTSSVSYPYVSPRFPATIQANIQPPIKDVPILVEAPGLNQTIMTDANGQIKVSYPGQVNPPPVIGPMLNENQRTISVRCGSEQKQHTVDEFREFWVSKDGKWSMDQIGIIAGRNTSAGGNRIFLTTIERCAFTVHKEPVINCINFNSQIIVRFDPLNEWMGSNDFSSSQTMVVGVVGEGWSYWYDTSVVPDFGMSYIMGINNNQVVIQTPMATIFSTKLVPNSEHVNEPCKFCIGINKGSANFIINQLYWTGRR